MLALQEAHILLHNWLGVKAIHQHIECAATVWADWLCRVVVEFGQDANLFDLVYHAILDEPLPRDLCSLLSPRAEDG